MPAIDLYSGIGGWSLGLHMAGIEVLRSYEWWDEANYTHNTNFGYNNPDIDIRSLVGEEGVIRPDLLPHPDQISIIVGSPPCTQFSYANRGGSGDIQDGLIDIHAFLTIVDYLQPNHWAMENVPRVAEILRTQVFEEEGSLSKFRHLFNDDPTNIQIYLTSDFGVPQRRKRMIAGNFNHVLLNGYREAINEITLGQVLDALNANVVIDPIYDIELNQDELVDHIAEDILDWEEERINRESKEFHPVYNIMNFPENIEVPSRTVTALCTRVSRESIIIPTDNGFRRLTVRERGVLQSFPITYQFYGKSYSSKLKMIGNAIPPLLSYYVVCAMLEIENPLLPEDAQYLHESPNEQPVIYNPPNNGRHFRKERKFHAAIPNLRFGSGVRFDLKNGKFGSSEEITWEIGFYYGNSKKIKDLKLDHDLILRTRNFLLRNGVDVRDIITEYTTYLSTVCIENLHPRWLHLNENGIHPFELIDRIGEFSQIIKDRLIGEDDTYVEFVVQRLNDNTRKIQELSRSIISGFILGGLFNHYVQTGVCEVFREIEATIEE